ncbi:diaminopimelate epimerase [Bacillus oleivorans]|uniref:Diaminopimelate epimerase n=1 Tax=Bacillus oleivorans TaxID=1448271 RepID=A0A285CLW9_9BACI|nr:diaminopimelate epimerase [Bacillus oleivorans]SNX68395.1 diaminopimelate epimerase [Bacillus oleivorans]
MQFPYTKVHGSRNDFILIDEAAVGTNWADEERVHLTLRLCNRQEGIGADGILFVSESNKADGKMRVFNADGSEASMCGNGLRCVARYLIEKHGKEELKVETMKATLSVKKEAEIFPDIPTFAVEISPVSFNPSDLPMNVKMDAVINQVIPEIQPERKWSALAVPNPHLITVVDGDIIKSNEQKKIAQYLNGENPICPDGVNVSYVVPLSEGNIFVKTYERGVGFTNACGTAMSASTFITCELGLNNWGEKINVFNPGGKVQCIAHNTSDNVSIQLIGNATYEHEGVIHWNDQDISFSVQTQFENEQQAYKKLEENIGTVLAF